MNETNETTILAINGGSSSIKFALYENGEALKQVFSGQVDRIGLSDTTLTLIDTIDGTRETLNIAASTYHDAITRLIDTLRERIDPVLITAVGHRIVHGMHYTDHQVVTPALLDELRAWCSFDPNHLPREIEIIEEFMERYPSLHHVACFDTVFHRTMPRVAELLPIPRRFEKMGVKRYGFHGLSYEYLMRELARQAGNEVSRGRVIIAHLGSGASVCALKDGASIDTSMGFTPSGGITMSTRMGDIDPGALWFIMQKEALSADDLNTLINFESGLLGISEMSPAMHELLAQKKEDVRAAEAVELFCYEVKKMIGAYAAVLGGVDTLIFSGGIGEAATEVRARVCDGLDFLGITIDDTRNATNESVISRDGGRTTVRVIHTNEELLIAETAARLTQQ